MINSSGTNVADTTVPPGAATGTAAKAGMMTERTNAMTNMMTVMIAGMNTERTDAMTNMMTAMIAGMSTVKTDVMTTGLGDKTEGAAPAAPFLLSYFPV